jgi:SAM-dependent methyltransferase
VKSDAIPPKLGERVDLMAPRLLDELRSAVEAYRELAAELDVGLGWHYLLDLPWALHQLEGIAVPGSRGLDAGAGIGLMQWSLARRGVEILSVDRGSRARIPLRFQERFPISGLRRSDLSPIAGIRGRLRAWLGRMRPDVAPGRIVLYNQDLRDLRDVPDDSLDFVVSISALEHNPPDDLRVVVRELMRVLKPGAPLVATVGAARDADWFHEPSRGWCYTVETLRELFELAEDCPDDYDRFDATLDALRACDELRVNLSRTYFERGDNGMPFGIWNPQYLSVGIVKVKPTSA